MNMHQVYSKANSKSKLLKFNKTLTEKEGLVKPQLKVNDTKTKNLAFLLNLNLTKKS